MHILKNLLLLFAICFWSTDSKKIAWVPVKEFQQGAFEPAGFERIAGANEIYAEKKPFYIARGYVKDGHAIGKFSPTLKKTIFPPHIKIDQKKGIELLSFPPGSTSWVDVVGIQIPSNWELIDAGRGHDHKEELCICRALHHGELLIGTFLNSKGTCHIHSREGALEIRNFEILIDNLFGNILGEKADTVVVADNL